MPILFRSIFICLFILFYNNVCFAQAHFLKQVPGLPSNEIYDILTDSKGFLWIAHDGGISKYDGISFTNYSNQQQSSLATTNILEDKFGRIWFVNFTGQIFYIENGHVNLLQAYQSETENYFPRMGLLNNLLVATSKKGLFICDTKTLKCHYEDCGNCNNAGKRTVILSILKDKALIFGGRNSYVYRPGKGMRLAVSNDKEWAVIESGSANLCIHSYNDTSFIYTNPSNVFYKLVVTGDTVKICEKKQFDNFINTVSLINNKYWINTVNSTYPGYGRDQPIKGYDLSCITRDKEGRIWYGSLQRGLLTDSIKTDSIKGRHIFNVDRGDAIKCLIRNNQSLLLGTQNGNLLSYDTHTDKSSLLTALPSKHGGISYIKILKDNNILIGTSVNTYIFNIKTHQVKSLDPVKSLKQADQLDDALILSSSNSLIVLPYGNQKFRFQDWKTSFKKRFKGLVQQPDSISQFIFYEERTKAVCYSPKSNTIWVSFKSGLYSINKSGVHPFYDNKLPVYTSCLTRYGDEIIAGTFNNGIVIISDGTIKHLTSEDGLLSNNILKVKVVDNNLWVYTNGAVQIFNLKTLKLIYKYPFPGVNTAYLTDATEIDGYCYFSSLNGLYKIAPVEKKADSISLYLNSLFINHKDTGVVNNLVLPYSSNDIQVSLGTPYLSSARDMVIRYHLRSSDSSKWVYGRMNERSFHFASLAPGVYSFEAEAIKRQTGLSSNPFIINFTIRPPWWQTWWFRLIIVLASLVVIVTILRIYFLNKIRQQQIEFEKKLIVERERQHISREIHDNIGQALSVIKLNLDMSSPSEVSDVKELIGEVIQDVRQFTHGLYYGKLLTDSLLDTIQKDIDRLNNSKQLKATLEIKAAKKPMNEQSELLIYRIFQEAINNILKHSGAKNVAVQITNTKKQFKLSITDDGIGFSAHTSGKGLGLASMYKRAELLNGRLTISGKPGEGCEVGLIIDHKI